MVVLLVCGNVQNMMYEMMMVDSVVVAEHQPLLHIHILTIGVTCNGISYILVHY